MKKRSKLDLSSGPALDKVQAVRLDNLQLEEAAPEVAGVRPDRAKVTEGPEAAVSGRLPASRRPTGKQIAGTVVLVAVAALTIYALTRRLLR